ncbi:hypothetical protein TNCV_2373701 [Trichonephila clavipes]|nr:hypothetical protein TNCV_2373701 [Trichonephila clavipes]
MIWRNIPQATGKETIGMVVCLCEEALGSTELYILNRDLLTGNHYSVEISFFNMHPFQGVIGPNFVFMNDNAQPQRLHAVREL